MDFDLQARDGADVQAVEAHGGELAVHRLDHEEGPQTTLRGPRVRAMVSVRRGTSTPTPVVRMVASSGALLSPLAP